MSECHFSSFCMYLLLQWELIVLHFLVWIGAIVWICHHLGKINANFFCWFTHLKECWTLTGELRKKIWLRTKGMKHQKFKELRDFSKLIFWCVDRYNSTKLILSFSSLWRHKISLFIAYNIVTFNFAKFH